MIIIAIIIIYALIGSAYWLLTLYYTVKGTVYGTRLDEIECTEPAKWPVVSVILTACNEAQDIEEAVNSRLKDGYPGLEVIMVDDRSTDATPAIVDRIAASDPRAKAIHVTKLPPGWLGKVHAMQRGLEASSGEWLLFSDADVRVGPGALKKIISIAENKGLGHVSLLPDLYEISFLLDTALSVFIRWLCLTAKMKKADEENSSYAMGAGAFNLIRRSLFEKTKGFEWIKMEVADDMALGQMVKDAGGKSLLINAAGHVGVYFYRSLKDAVKGSERASYTVIGDFSLVKLLLISTVIFLLELFPFIALLSGYPYLQYLGAVVTVIAMYSLVRINRWANRSVLTAVAMPVGVILMCVYLVRAGLLGALRGGIYWRGQFYSNDELKRGRRFSF